MLQSGTRAVRGGCAARQDTKRGLTFGAELIDLLLATCEAG